MLCVSAAAAADEEAAENAETKRSSPGVNACRASTSAGAMPVNCSATGPHRCANTVSAAAASTACSEVKSHLKKECRTNLQLITQDKCKAGLV